jgi:copper transport protein
MAVGGSLTSGLVSAWEIMSGTSYGLAWLFRQAALMLLIASLTFYRQRIGKLGVPSLARFAVLALALAIAFAQAFQSHVASSGEFVLLGVASSAVHIVAAGVWSGGLLALLVAAAPALQAGRDAAPLGWALLREFGRLAAASLAALLISGLLLTGQQVA